MCCYVKGGFSLTRTLGSVVRGAQSTNDERRNEQSGLPLRHNRARTPDLNDVRRHYIFVFSEIFGVIGFGVGDVASGIFSRYGG